MADPTPGPWREGWDYKRASSDSKRVFGYATGPQHSCVGVSIDDSDLLQPDRATMDKIVADAHLIAAAPELLAALEDLLDHAGEASERLECCALLERKARAAIANAKGGGT